MLANDKLNLVQDLVKEFSRDEIIWTNGYLTGLLNRTQEEQPKEIPTISNIKPTIIYGTETGNAKKLANQLNGIFKKNKIQSKAIDAFQYPLDKIEKEEFLILIFSTQGDGDLPENAQKFYENLTNLDINLTKTQFAVFGLGDTSYPFFCKSGEDIDQLFEKLGANRALNLVKSDVDFQETAEDWFNNVLKIIQSNSSVTQTELPKTTGKTAQKKSFQGRVKHKVILNDRGSNKETYHVEIEVDEKVDYEPGDALGIYPKNNLEEISTIAQFLNAESRSAELENKNISVLSKKILNQLSTYLNVEIAETKIDLIDLFVKYYSKESSLTFDILLDILHQNPPRLYSISSSNEAHDNEIHLTVNLHTFFVDDKHKKGVCSSYIADFEENKEIDFYIHKNKNFKLPAEDQSVIMIGPGTGIAPFRSFLSHRDASGGDGKNWLFFGEQHFVSDFYYQTEIQEWLSTGVLTKLDTAFSRDQKQKIYVQDRIQEQGKELFKWLNDGAYLYICGQKNNMSLDVEKALIKIISKELEIDKIEAENYLEELEQSGRYQKDVY
jgi:sulfite reductase (NADPH) flavoprotein alpha-component